MLEITEKYILNRIVYLNILSPTPSLLLNTTKITTAAFSSSIKAYGHPMRISPSLALSPLKSRDAHLTSANHRGGLIANEKTRKKAAVKECGFVHGAGITVHS